jgi:hypothetical protein
VDRVAPSFQSGREVPPRKRRTTDAPLPLRSIAVLIGLTSFAAGTPGQTPFATEVLSYDPAPGQRVNDPHFNDPARALGAPLGGTRSVPNQNSIVTLGDFGGSITLAFDHTVMDEPLNPFGLDAIVFGNAFWPGSNPQSHWAECATIEICRDDNDNGWPDEDEPWFLIPGSHLPDPLDAWMELTWDDDTSDPIYAPILDSWIPPGRKGQWMTSGFQLPSMVFGGLIVQNPLSPKGTEGIWGYADFTPTLALGDLNADDIVDDLKITPDPFYVVPDDPLSVGISPGSGGGDAFDIAWGIDPVTGHSAKLDGFDFIRITSAVRVAPGALGEKSAEVDAVADVAIDPTGDADADGDIDLLDIAAAQNCFADALLFDATCTRLTRDDDEYLDLADIEYIVKRFTGPQ